jgi:hypothetical protein
MLMSPASEVPADALPMEAAEAATMAMMVWRFM